jgi:hypothetical protein
LMKWYIPMVLLYAAPYLTFFAIFLTLYIIIVHENAWAIYAKNREIVRDTFQNMVYSESLCARGESNNIWYTVSPSEIDQFNFPPRTTEELLKREDEEKIRFMVYNNEFQKYHEKLKGPRIAIWAHMVLNVLLFIIMQKLVYEPLFWFSLLHPFDSVMKCGEKLTS